MSVLVTGGAGFIGSHLVDALVERGARVRVLDDLSTGKLKNLERSRDAIELIEGDIRDADVCHGACEGVVYVFHQAAIGSVPRSMKDPATTFDVNVRGTANVFAACRDARVSRVVYASSSSVYGDSATLPKREGEEGRPLSPYALSKTMNEQLADVFGRCYAMRFLGLRYFNVYGPRQDPEGPYAAVVPRFLAAVRSGTPPVIYGDGEQSRDFTFVADAVEANLLAAGAPDAACGRAYNVAPGSRLTVNELAGAILAASGGGPAPVHVDPRPGDILHSQADSSAALRDLGFSGRVGLDQGVRLTVAALAEEYGPGLSG
ncbi:MAG: SDR family oxidoreductase [Thermoanaerobaculia bacterium]|nr:SDR family oxidoreductase [Thermoanaerobaculia bacterium]